MTDRSTKKKHPVPARHLGRPLLVGLLVGVGVFFGVRWMQRGFQAPPSSGAPAKAASLATAYDALKGRWIREDGYVIEVRGVDTSGRLDAGYLNPRPINVAKAQASQKDGKMEVFVELRDIGYPGSTYNLAYDAPTDRLLGVYYQAAVHERYRVAFARAR